MNPLKLSHILWNEHLKHINKKNPYIVDATCGNGHDSLFLASFEEAEIHCLDIQKSAIENTKQRLSNQKNKNIHYHNISHKTLSFLGKKIDLIVYNLGYLPGSNKEIITQAQTTLMSLKSALSLLSTKGMISMMIYTGHPGGLEEKELIMNYIKTLPPNYSINHITNPQKPTSAEILTIYRK